MKLLKKPLLQILKKLYQDLILDYFYQSFFNCTKRASIIEISSKIINDIGKAFEPWVSNKLINVKKDIRDENKIIDK